MQYQKISMMILALKLNKLVRLSSNLWIGMMTDIHDEADVLRCSL